MTTKELLKAEIDNIDDADLDELYAVVKRFQQVKAQVKIATDPAEPIASGLCGIWQDERTAEEIIEDIISARSQSRDVVL